MSAKRARRGCTRVVIVLLVALSSVVVLFLLFPTLEGPCAWRGNKVLLGGNVTAPVSCFGLPCSGSADFQTREGSGLQITRRCVFGTLARQSFGAVCLLGASDGEHSQYRAPLLKERLKEMMGQGYRLQVLGVRQIHALGRRVTAYAFLLQTAHQKEAFAEVAWLPLGDVTAELWVVNAERPASVSEIPFSRSHALTLWLARALDALFNF